jgi:hypothetical protein
MDLRSFRRLCKIDTSISSILYSGQGNGKKDMCRSSNQ